MRFPYRLGSGRRNKNNTMKTLLLLLIIVEYCISENRPAPCSGLNPYRIVSPSAVGRWYLVRASRIGNVTEHKNTCGFFNTISPCACIGVNINSTILPPRVPSYTLQNFGYNEKFNSYAVTKIQLNLISNSSSIFNAHVPLAKVNFTIAVLGTDDYLSWITLAMCDLLRDHQGEVMQLKWIITRSPIPTNQTLERATDAITHGLNQSADNLVEINQQQCPPTL